MAEDILIVTVPGALEIPFALQKMAESQQFDALVALGAVIRGETYHFELVSNESAAGISKVALAFDIPVANGVLTTENDAQAEARVDDKGRDAASAAVEMANLAASPRGPRRVRRRRAAVARAPPRDPPSRRVRATRTTPLNAPTTPTTRRSPRSSADRRRARVAAPANSRCRACTNGCCRATPATRTPARSTRTSARRPGSSKADAEHYDALLHGAIREVASLRAAISPHLDRPIVELSPVEHGVLLIGAYELAHHVEIPYRVVINEAVEVAKSFGGTDGFKYVNGVLDKLGADLRPDESAARRPR